MKDFTIFFKPSARKEFRSLGPDYKPRITEAIDGLALNPRPKGTTKLRKGDIIYRIRIGSYRLVYEIYEDERVIRITRIRRRGRVYRQLSI